MNLREAWGEVFNGFDDVAFDVMMLTAKPRKPLHVQEVPDTLLAPTLMLAAEEPKIVDDLEELVVRMEHGFPAPRHFFTFEASVYCIKYRAGHPEERPQHGANNAERIRKAIEAWQ